MAETPAPGQQQVQIRIDESQMTSGYANMVRPWATNDEVVLDFGMQIPMQGQDGQQQLLLKMSSRSVMNWQSAKRTAMVLGQLVRNYEERNGEIQINPPAASSGVPQGGNPA